MLCYVCGREITNPTKAVAVLVIESHSGRVGSALLHGDCCCLPDPICYRQTVEWEGTVKDLAALHQRVATLNGSLSGSVPLLLA